MKEALDFLVSFWSKMLDSLSGMQVIEGVSLVDVFIASFIILTIILVVFSSRGGVK